MRIVYVPGTRESPGNVNGPCPASAAGTATIKRANSLVMIFTALSNGSRLSCGRLPRRRKGVGRQSAHARRKHSGSLKPITARQLQALVRRLEFLVKNISQVDLSDACVPDRDAHYV